MKKVLVTGGAGHVGSHVIEQLASRPNCQIVSLDDYSTGSEANEIPSKKVTYIHASTNDIDFILGGPFDVVYHLGEYARVAPSFDDVQSVYESNILGTFRVVEYCRKTGAKLVYAASSTKFAVEGDGRNQNPYSFSKATNVDLINNYGRWYDLNYAICYFNNAYGPREAREGQYATLIGRYEHAYLTNQPLVVVLPGTQRRHFTHVSDLARGMIMVAEAGYGDGYYLGHREGFSVREVAEAFGGEIVEIEGYSGRQDAGEAPDLARAELGWETTIDIMDYIKEFKKQHVKTRTARV